MRVYATTPAAPAPAALGARRAVNGAFTLPAERAAHGAAPAAGLRSVASIETLIALQAFGEEASERRRRAVQRGRNVLGALDALRAGVLAGRLDPETLARLRTTAGALERDTGDTGLDAVLAAIELRAEVELAKMDQLRNGAVAGPAGR